MKLYYIDDSLFQDSPFAEKVRKRFISLLRKNSVKLILISSSKEPNSLLQEFIASCQGIPVLVSPALFDMEGIRGQLHSAFLAIEGYPSMQSYSGSCVEYDEKSGTCKRIYLDLFPSYERETALQVEEFKEELLQLLEKLKDKCMFS